jgi:hypothetical protein
MLVFDNFIIIYEQNVPINKQHCMKYTFPTTEMFH